MYKKTFIIFLPVVLLPVTLFGQVGTHLHQTSEASAFHKIDLAYQQGELTIDQAVLQKFYVVFEPEKAIPAYLPENRNLTIRCLTPLIADLERNKEALSPATHAELKSYSQHICSQPDTEFSYISESGRFIFYYDTDDSPHAVPSKSTNEPGIPDYVLKTVFAMDSTWNHLIGTLGFENPVINPNTPYEIRYRDLGIDTYGYTCQDFSTANTFVIMHNNFEGFIDNNHPEGNQAGALYATSAHEFKHASQFATNRWREPAGSTSWIEMDATMIEDIIFSDVHDNLQFLRADNDPSLPGFNTIFGNPENPVPVAYNHFTWKLYFAEKLGMEFWSDVWSRFRSNSKKPFIEAMEESLELFDTSFEQEHVESLVWHLASGPSHSATEFGFKNRGLYPNPNFNQVFNHLPDSSTASNSLQHLAASFYLVQPALSESGNVKISAEFDNEGAHLGLIGYFRDGSVHFFQNNQNGNQSAIEPRWLWEDLQKLGIVIVNLNEMDDKEIQYTIRVDSTIPDQIALFQNYPNPFNPATNIQFFNDRQRRVRVDVFDVIGRHIQTLTDREYQQGHHNLRFEAPDLASGIYIYSLTGGNQRISKKMIILK